HWRCGRSNHASAKTGAGAAGGTNALGAIDVASCAEASSARNTPEVFQGGNSKAARRMAAKYSDWYFINGNSVESVKEQIDEVRALARAKGRTVKFGLNGFVIQRP